MSYKTLFFFVSVFFTTGYATRWPTFTNCTLTEYLCDTRKCITQFIKNVQNDTEGDCGVQYNKTLACIITSNKICGRVYSSNLSNMTLGDSLRAGISEDQMCKEAFLGEFLVPWHISTLNGYCSRVFVNNTEACLKTFHDKFMANRSDTTLCEEHAEAKRCWMETIMSDCKFPTDIFEVIKFDLVDYNPFCASNRDPGATGNDECHGVRDIKNDVSATAVIKINTSLALLLPLVSFLFVFKV